MAQDDILCFCKNDGGSYQSPKWPDDYWPKDRAPSSVSAWGKSIKQYHSDLDEFAELILDVRSKLFETFPWGDGQTLFREAIVLIDHAAYHLGEIVTVRRALKIWPPR